MGFQDDEVTSKHLTRTRESRFSKITLLLSRNAPKVIEKRHYKGRIAI